MKGTQGEVHTVHGNKAEAGLAVTSYGHVLESQVL